MRSISPSDGLVYSPDGDNNDPEKMAAEKCVKLKHFMIRTVPNGPMKTK